MSSKGSESDVYKEMGDQTRWWPYQHPHTCHRRLAWWQHARSHGFGIRPLCWDTNHSVVSAVVPYYQPWKWISASVFIIPHLAQGTQNRDPTFICPSWRWYQNILVHCISRFVWKTYLYSLVQSLGYLSGRTRHHTLDAANFLDYGEWSTL